MPPPMISVSTFADQVAEQIELGRNLGAADDRRHRPLGRCSASRARRVLLHGAAGIGRQEDARSRSTEACARCATEKASST
jgi:hypothetical protein